MLVCKKLGRVIPQVFDGVTDYIDILIPDNLLNDTGFITKVINEVPESNYSQVEIIGWLYQFYISEKKDDVIKESLKDWDSFDSIKGWIDEIFIVSYYYFKKWLYFLNNSNYTPIDIIDIF